MAFQNFAVFVEGLDTLKDYERLGENIRLNAIRAINRTADTTRTAGAKAIREQVNFPASYLSPSDRRFYVSRKASGTNLEAVITARSRATSLARFIKSTPAAGGVRVEVKPGTLRFLPRAFVIKLPAGRAPIDTRSNLGLAVRLKRGDALRNKTSVVRMQNGLYLLYGPSVQQVFIDNSGEGVAEDLEPFVLDKMENEFFRLMDLDL